MRTLQEMLVKPGEPVSAAKWNGLLAALRSLQIVGGREIEIRRTPHGTFVSARPQALPARGAFAVSVSGRVARVDRGLVEGIEPTIGEDPPRRIGGDPLRPQDGVPSLALPKPTAPEGWMYLRCSLDEGSWRISKAEVVFLSEPPKPEPWVAFKLLAILRREALEGWQLALQAVHFNLGHYAYGRRTGGRARHLWFAR